MTKVTCKGLLGEKDLFAEPPVNVVAVYKNKCNHKHNAHKLREHQSIKLFIALHDTPLHVKEKV